MKNLKSCEKTSCCWNMRHEVLGIILLVIAAFLTIVTCNGLGIFAMFLAGAILCSYKHIACHKHHGDDHCHYDDEHCGDHVVKAAEKQPVKKSTVKAKK